MIGSFLDLEQRIFFKYMSTKHYTDETAKNKISKDKYRIRDDIVKELKGGDYAKLNDTELETHVTQGNIQEAMEVYTKCPRNGLPHHGLANNEGFNRLV